MAIAVEAMLAIAMVFTPHANAGTPTPDIKVSVIENGSPVELISDPVNALPPVSFGTTTQGDDVVREFLIENVGDANLVLAGTIALEPDDDYSVVNVLSPDQLVIAPGGSVSFSIRLNAFSQGDKLDLVRIQSTDPDPDEDPFRFRVQGFVQQPPEVLLSVGGVEVPSGGVVTFDHALVGGESERTFTVSNAGTLALSIGPVSVPDGYELVAQPAGLLADAGDSTTFTVRARTDVAGPRAGLMTFSTGDPDESPYAVRLSGSVARTDDGPKPGVRAGREVSSAGDMNGDGFDDVILASRDGDDAGPDAGQVYVFSGQTGELLYQINGASPDDRLGWGITPMGDLNGDGLGDIAISAPPPAHAYVFYARPASSDYPLLLSAAEADITITGESTEDAFGNSMGSAGDIDLDGLQDLLIGAPGHEGPAGVNAGRAYVFTQLGPGGSASRSVADAAIIMDGEQAFSNFGSATGALGDVNLDGFPDFVVGASSGGTPLVGRAYVFFSPFASSPALPVVTPAASADFRFEGLTVAERFGRTVLGPGDLDGDGVPDLLVGAPATTPVVGVALGDDEAGVSEDSGAVYVFALNPFGSTQIISAATASVCIFGEMPQDSFASALAPAGDVDRDGLSDFIVGAPDFDGEGGGMTENWGRAYLFTSPWAGGGVPAAQMLAADDARATMTGEGRNDRLGIAAGFAGDVNGDGAPDVIVGAPNNDQGTGLNSHNGGRAYTLFGDPLACRSIWRAGAGSPGEVGMNGSVRALASFAPYAGAEQALHAGGFFSSAGGVVASGVARWTGAAWQALGSPGAEGVNGPVYAMTTGVIAGQRRLFVAGAFSAASGQSAMNIASWDGQAWHTLGAGLNGTVRALCVFDDGTGPALYAGGDFTLDGAGAIALNRMARWDGNQWTGVGGGVNDSVYALASFDDGTGESLFAGGRFTTAGSPAPVAALRLAAWDGAAWRSLGGGLNGQVSALAAFGSGADESLYVAGNFTSAGAPAPVAAAGIARWQNQQWLALGGGLGGGGAFPFANALAVYDDGSGGGEALYVAGSFTTADGIEAPRIARWSGDAWSALDAGLDDTAYALAVFDETDGKNLAVGGRFLNADDEPQSRVSCWDGCLAPLSAVYDRFGDGARALLWDAVQFAGSLVPVAPVEMDDALRFTLQSAPALGPVGGAGYASAVWSIDTSRDWALRCEWACALPALNGKIELRLEFPRALTPDDGPMGDGVAAVVGRDGLGAYTAVEKRSAGALVSLMREARGQDAGEFFVWYDHTADTFWASTTGFDESGAIPVENFGALAGSNLVGVRLLVVAQGPHPAVNGDGLNLSNFRVVAGFAVQEEPPALCPGDTNGDAEVDFADLNQVVGNWGSSQPPGEGGDVTRDGAVDFADLNQVIANWQAICTN